MGDKKRPDHPIKRGSVRNVRITKRKHKEHYGQGWLNAKRKNNRHLRGKEGAFKRKEVR